nr:hypothetical protein [Woeseiaceae bacterium]
NGFDFEDSLYKEEWEESWLLEDEGRFDANNNVPQEIANAVIDILESETPKTRYMIVGTQNTATVTVKKAMREMVQLNEGQPHTLSRDELVEMLDELLAE